MASHERVYHYPRGNLYTSVSTKSLDAVVDRTLGRAVHYERQLRELESKLSEHLGNYRAIDSLLEEAVTTVKRNSAGAAKAESFHVPQMDRKLRDSEEKLSDLTVGLPRVSSEVKQIRAVYESGRLKAQQLVFDLEWLNLDWYDRWRRIIFTTSSPVSWRWKTLMRALFAAFFLAFAWVVWIALRGAYRAHRQRLVWGERVLS